MSEHSTLSGQKFVKSKTLTMCLVTFTSSTHQKKMKGTEVNEWSDPRRKFGTVRINQR